MGKYWHAPGLNPEKGLLFVSGRSGERSKIRARGVAFKVYKSSIASTKLV